MPSQHDSRTRDDRREIEGSAHLAIGVFELLGVRRQLRRLPHTGRYLIAYMAFNDAIQTVVSIASVFLAQELFVSRGLPTNEAFLMPTGRRERPAWLAHHEITMFEFHLGALSHS